MSKFCGNCGKEVNEYQNVCLNCGVSITPSIKPNSKADKNALVGFILGLVSIIAWLLPFIGYPVCICGIIFSAKGLKSTNSKGKAIAGLVLSIVFLMFTLMNSLIGIIMWTEIFNNNYYYDYSYGYDYYY